MRTICSAVPDALAALARPGRPARIALHEAVGGAHPTICAAPMHAARHDGSVAITPELPKVGPWQFILAAGGANVSSGRLAVPAVRCVYPGPRSDHDP
ncbi:hypothetical protein D3C84_949730 [compost metagenome]